MGPCTESVNILLLSACVGSAKSDFASMITKGAFKISKAKKVNKTMTAAPVKSVINSVLPGRTLQESVLPSDQAMKIPHF
jgi:hypothetical protein